MHLYRPSCSKHDYAHPGASLSCCRADANHRLPMIKTILAKENLQSLVNLLKHTLEQKKLPLDSLSV